MESKAKLLGHPIHPMLIVFPLGLLSMAVIFDLIALSTANGYWAGIAYYLIAAGVIGGLVAALFGLIDWLAIPGGTRAKSIGLWHGLGNVVALPPSRSPPQRRGGASWRTSSARSSTPSTAPST